MNNEKKSKRSLDAPLSHNPQQKKSNERRRLFVLFFILE